MTKRIRHLFRRLVDLDVLDAAATTTCRGKRRRPDVAWFLFDRERHLRSIRGGLLKGTWQPNGFEQLLIRDPKPRVISRASVADRVVHTALATLLEPTLLRSAAPGDLACRAGGGQHRAVLRLLALQRRFRFALHLDVRAYFPSVDLEILTRLLASRVEDDEYLAIVARVLESGRGLYDSRQARRYARLSDDWPPRGQGLPMGAVTSQLFATHLYLQAFDHWVARDLKCRGYVRYVDDLFLFDSDRHRLQDWRGAVGDWLASERRLRLKHPDARVLSCAGHLDALGFRIRRDRIEPLPRTWRRLRSRVGDHVRTGRPGAARLRRSLQASLGQAFLV